MHFQKPALFTLIALLVGCASNDVDKEFDCSTVTITVQLISKTDVSGCSATDGTIEVIAADGEGPYEYSINGGTFSTSSVFQNLSTGTYTLQARDANGCIGMLAPEPTIINPASDLTASINNSANDTECLSDNGSISVSASGGAPPYVYQRVGTAFTDNPVFTNLASGNYTITVKDAAGCTFSVSKNVARGDTGTSWVGDVKGIIDANCAISTCHNGSQFPDLRQLSNVQSNASQIRSRTQSGNMPRNGTLTAEQKAKIACWVDDGAKNN